MEPSVPKDIIYEIYGYKMNVSHNSDGTYTYKEKQFFLYSTPTKVKYYGKKYKINKASAALDKNYNLIYIYKKKAYRGTPDGKKKMLTNKAGKLHGADTGYTDYIILTNGKKKKL